MEIRKPDWHLKKLCPCCEQGYPLFVKCPNCNFLTVRCEEMGDTYSNPHNLLSDDCFTTYCPLCKKTETKDFVQAEPDDILNAGFTKEEYE